MHVYSDSTQTALRYYLLNATMKGIHNSPIYNSLSIVPILIYSKKNLSALLLNTFT